MSPFKEPQPRKNSVEKDAEKVVGGVWPPYERLGGEARWDGGTPIVSDKTVDELANTASPNARWTMTEAEFFESLDTAREEGRAEVRADLGIRKAALEAAVKHFSGVNRNGDLTIELAAKFEDYLRDGTKPS